MKIYKITEASEYLGVSINTLKTLANNGKIKSFKTTGEHRRFRQEDLDAYMGVEKEKQEKLTVIYARCSTAKQKENLERQKDRLRKHAESKGYKYMMIDEIASGINEKRNGIHKLIKMCFEGKVERVLIEYKDRLARFGYEYLDAIFTNLEITVEIMEVKDKKYEEELAEDIMKILTCYSARYYGARGGRKKKIKVENEPVESNGISKGGNMKPSEHEVKFTELLDSMPTPELSKELVRLVIQHDISLEGANHMAEFFNRVEAEKCIGEVATYGAYAYPQQQFWTDI